MKKQEIWLQCGEKRFQLPINPPSFSVQLNMGVSSQTLNNFGEMTVLEKRGLRRFSISSIWPAQMHSYCMCKPAFTPYNFRKFINQHKHDIFRVTVSDTSIKAVKFVISDWTYDEYDYEGDMKYTINFIEYRVPSVKKTSSSSKTETTTTIKVETKREVEKEKTQTYIVKENDCLWNIAQKFYGSGSKQTELYNKNKDIIEATAKKYGKSCSSYKGVPGWWIYPGTKLVI